MDPPSLISPDSTRSVLIVDDQPAVLTAIRMLFEEVGLEVRTALGGEAALQVLETWSPSLLLTDLQMPGMDGVALAAEAHRLRPSLRIVLMTNLPDAALESRVVTAYGPGAFLIKPLRVDDWELFARLLQDPRFPTERGIREPMVHEGQAPDPCGACGSPVCGCPPDAVRA